MDSQDDDRIQFTDEPCPECKKAGDETGYVVNMDCDLCLGTGRARKQ